MTFASLPLKYTKSSFKRKENRTKNKKDGWNTLPYSTISEADLKHHHLHSPASYQPKQKGTTQRLKWLSYFEYVKCELKRGCPN